MKIAPRLLALALLLNVAGALPALAGFSSRKLVTVTGSQVVGGPHVNFPVIVGVADPELRLAPAGGVRSPQGCDITFRASDGVTPLDYEILAYAGGTGSLGAYVKLPSVQNGVNTQFYIYYGDPELNCRQSRHGDVWDAGYRFVLNFAETSGNPLDSTANGVAARKNPQGDPAATHAQNGQSFEMITPPSAPPATFGPTTDSHLQMADGTLAANTPFTIEAWFYLRSLAAGQYVGLVTKNRDGCVFPCDSPGEDWIGMGKTDTNRLSLLMDTQGGPGNLDGGTVLVAGRWYYGAVTSNGANTRRVFIYDALDAENIFAVANYTALALPTRIGDDSNGNYLDGYITSVRFSTVARSPEWIRTSARAGGCSTTTAPAPSCSGTLPLSLQTPFLTVGAAQALAATSTDPDCCRIATTDDGTRVTAQTSALSMVFDRTDAGGLAELRNEEEANRTQSRHANTSNYNIFSTQVNDSTNTWHFERDAAGQIEVIEATPTRLKLRQLYDYMPSVHLQRTWTIGAMPRLAIDERLVVDSTQDLRGAQGIHARGATSGAAGICPSQLISSGFGTFFYCNGQENSTDRFFLVTDDHETYGDMLAVAHTTPFFGPTRAGTGGNYQHSWEGGTPETFFSRVHEPTRISTNAGTYRNLYMFYPSLAGLTSGGTQWQPYASDYRTPDVLSFAIGTGWFDAGDQTVSPNDTWNEAEGAYQVDFNPATGLTLDIDGNVTVRRRPLLKIRQWRSFSDPIVSLEGTPLVNDRDFTADVKPFVRGFHCTGPGDFTGCTALANGGLASASEYLNDPAGGKNYTLAFPNGTTFFYLGAETKFRGVNVLLSQAGAGTADLQWEYWNGAWTSLEAIVNWTDTTNSLKRSGTLSWGSDAPETDPAGWTTLSIAGSPPLYYVRARLASGSYTTPPIESVVRTDILLFQYCSDVSVLGATFAFSVPAPTAVSLMSFGAVAGDGSVTLEWRTGSELQNLGFHLYRGSSADGPWTRITPELIPGLGSSALGQAYAYRDAGLTNGVRYYYRLEDVDASSKVTSHGPVWAIPQASIADDGDADGTRGRKRRGEAAASGCPAWVLADYAPAGDLSATPRCTRHGDPEATGLRVASRDARGATLELTTGGFYALHEAAGTVRVFVPGFDFADDARGPALPVRRALVEAVVGRGVQLGGVRALRPESFPGLAPSALGTAEMELAWDGTARAARRSGRPALRGTSDLARLLPSVFQGETKSAVVELKPLRYDATRRAVLLARTLRVRLLFSGREPGERGRLGRGRRAPQPPLASGEVLARLFTTRRGLYAVSFEELFPAERRGVEASGLGLERQGAPVAFQLVPDTASFGPGSRLFFFADAAPSSTAYSPEIAYELVRSSAGRRMAKASAAPNGAALQASIGPVAFETNRYYQPGLLDAPDPWLWEAFAAGVARVMPLSLDGVDPGSPEPAEIDVLLQGASESGLPVDHHVGVSINGSPIGEARFAGKRPYRVSLAFPAALLREGANELTIANLGDTGVASLVFLDRVELACPQRAAARAGRFEGVFARGGAAQVATEATAQALVDVTAGEAPVWLTGFPAGPSGASFRAEAGRLYLLAAEAGLFAPRVVPSPPASGLRSAQHQADYLLIAPREFLPAAEPLVARRADQGLRTRAVALEEIAAAFGHGQPSAEAIRDFIAFAFHGWAEPSPRYVLLLGDSSYDPRNFIGSSPAAPLPSLYTRTSYLWTVSDPRLAAVNGEDALPDLAIGRLPAANLEEARRLVDKLVAWEDSRQGLAGAAALVADDPDAGGDFEANAADIALSFFAGRSPRILKLRELGQDTRPGIRAALDSGLAWLGYVGHGGAAVWASENVWNSWDAASLQAQSRQPILVTMNCLNGYFVAPAYESLAESLVKPEGRGAIAALSPSGLSLDGPAHAYHRALTAEITSGRHQRLGDALLAAQAEYAASGLMPELVEVYHLFGDPAMPLR